MRLRQIIGLSMLALVVVFVGTVGGNIVTETIQNKERVADRQELFEQIDQLKLMTTLLDGSAPEFISRHSMTANDVHLFHVALSMSRQCDVADECMEYSEWTGGSTYHTIPYIATASRLNETYVVVPAVVEYGQSIGDYYSPRFTTYYRDGRGRRMKVTADGNVFYRFCGRSSSCSWRQLNDPGYVQQLREGALVALTQSSRQIP